MTSSQLKTPSEGVIEKLAQAALITVYRRLQTLSFIKLCQHLTSLMVMTTRLKPSLNQKQKMRLYKETIDSSSSSSNIIILKASQFLEKMISKWCLDNNNNMMKSSIIGKLKLWGNSLCLHRCQCLVISSNIKYYPVAIPSLNHSKLESRRASSNFMTNH